MREYSKESKTPFHIYNRGTDKRVIFTDYTEYCRFLFLMWVCRIGSPIVNVSSRKNIHQAAESIISGAEPDQMFYVKEHDSLVNFITWNLEPNHFHFILVSSVDGGIARYMSKLSNAYTKYFNAKHQRTGRLFQGSYQSIEIKNANYLYTLVRYINLNHLELIEPGWREGRIDNRAKAEEFANSYKWSGHPDFLGIRSSILINKIVASDLLEMRFTDKGLDGYSNFLENLPPNGVDLTPHMFNVKG